jgi:hypothetical protein
MVSKLIALTALLFLATKSFASGGCTKASEYEPALCPLLLPKIASVHIEENGAKAISSQDPDVDCSPFKLDITRVRKFLSLAKEANESDAHHTLDWSPCYSSGTLTFTSGKTAHWSINQLRTGSLTIDGGARVFLYCPTCAFKPFQ